MSIDREKFLETLADSFEAYYDLHLAAEDLGLPLIFRRITIPGRRGTGSARTFPSGATRPMSLHTYFPPPPLTGSWPQSASTMLWRKPCPW
ncbi:MAG: hypothetical protein V8T45_05385 [Oscillospiraceae bacterium]